MAYNKLRLKSTSSTKCCDLLFKTAKSMRLHIVSAHKDVIIEENHPGSIDLSEIQGTSYDNPILSENEQSTQSDELIPLHFEKGATCKSFFRTKLQKCVIDNTAEAEFIALEVGKLGIYHPKT
ncbi:hypothetical protein BLA29_005256 [Euroglyphus maynei]|uniref:Uncharacterized protein n=1 Tax=Euroglyphus maynei TaxID=6958 RepID=A0A1Y3BMD2_EURMA|nr:hypothetical protein BLA29_005256 [Euroglyphus maynei]